ncbi:HIT family protein [Candidatus Gottesmanbacteria bacterium]|nr:HIT family protein [Candidatus Gottesmanbacteria bacterium]
MNDCLFCKIIEGTIPANRVYEDKDFLAFLDISPVNPGHTLVLPKKHFETYLDTPDETLENLSKKVKKIALGIKEATEAEGINIMVNAHKAAGQVIPHLHTHVIPRYLSDGFKHWTGQKISEEKTKILAEKIRRDIKN